ncbi:hypothetical protein EC973_002894 [Apophysomyces ossiformis]|uniref:Uncharacterized protein n=1 Tax=Apophysomyces ossiformis TaxID=679940 RepID=A0A8H7EMA8_9FUNG|nr:hypothetical protein EC973_002894 [Apophysomyces ossiformis]
MRIAVIKRALAENRLGFEVLSISNADAETFSKLPVFVKAGVEKWIEANKDIGEHDNVMDLKIDDVEVVARLKIKPVATFDSVNQTL